jgi:hypothetical protein
LKERERERERERFLIKRESTNIHFVFVTHPTAVVYDLPVSISFLKKHRQKQ